jgi:hypothetical protein
MRQSDTNPPEVGVMSQDSGFGVPGDLNREVEHAMVARLPD